MRDPRRARQGRQARSTTTIQDVAKAAGVSPSTVSRVLSGSRPVQPELAERVQAAAAALEYQPSATARSLRTGRTETLGLLLPDLTFPLFTEIAFGVERAAAAAGYGVFLCNTREDAANEGRYLTLLRDRWVDGIICSITTASGENGPLQAVLDAGIPLVQFDRTDHGLAVSSVGIDHVAAGRMVARHLLDLGHRRFAVLAGPRTVRPFQERLAGVRAALAEAGIPLPADRVDDVPGFHAPLPPDGTLPAGLALPPAGSAYGFYVRYGAVAAGRALDHPEPPTAIVAANDAVALGALRAIEGRGLRVPGDVSLIGFDGIDVAAHLRPSLTTVAQPAEAIGAVAVELLLAALAAGDGEGTDDAGRVERRVLPAPLVARESTGVAADRGPRPIARGSAA